MTKAVVSIYAHGVTRTEPGVGGWGVVLTSGTNEKKLYGAEVGTTAVRVRALAVVKALRTIKAPSELKIFSEFPAIITAGSKYLSAWKAAEWKNGAGNLIANKEIWEEIDQLLMAHDVSWTLQPAEQTKQGREAATLCEQGADEAQDLVRSEPAVAASGPEAAAPVKSEASAPIAATDAAATENAAMKKLLAECLPLLSAGLPLDMLRSQAPSSLAVRAAAFCHG